jgi:hypothetical protein
MHPDGMYYAYVDCKPLYEYRIDELPELTPEMVNTIEVVVESKHTLVILTGQGTHDAVLALVGQLVAAGVSREIILRSVPALFPQVYKGNSLEELPGMVESAFEKGFDSAAASTAIDMQIARRLIFDLNPIVYVKGEGYRKYENGHWPELPEEKIRKLAMETIDALGGKNLVAPLIKHVMTCVELLTSQKSFGGYSSRVCCKNGTVDILTGQLLEWSPDHQLRYQLGIDYDPQAACPLYEQHLQQTLMNDEKAITAFDEFIGYGYRR